MAHYVICFQAIASVPEDQKDAAARGAKMRTLGNIRLIAELFKKSVVPEKIVHMCVSDLTGDSKQEPSENNVEVCTVKLCIPLPIWAYSASLELSKRSVNLVEADQPHRHVTCLTKDLSEVSICQLQLAETMGH